MFPSLPDTLDYPQNTISSLTKWCSISWTAFGQNCSTAMLIENELVGPNDLFYYATITRQKGIY